MGTFKSEKHDAEAIAVKGVSLLIFCRALDPSPTRVGLFRQFRLCGAAMELVKEVSIGRQDSNLGF